MDGFLSRFSSARAGKKTNGHTLQTTVTVTEQPFKLGVDEGMKLSYDEGGRVNISEAAGQS